MNNVEYTIILSDGTMLEHISMNGDNYIYPGELDTSIFTDDNLSPTVIKTKNSEEYHPFMKYTKPYSDDEDNTWFVLNDIPEDIIRERKMSEALSVLAQATLTDEVAEQAAILFPEWSGDGVQYTVGDRVRYNMRLAKCLQSHTSQPDWAPGVAPSLWSWITAEGDTTDPDTVEWPTWIQPTGGHDAYNKGAKVRHNGKHWISDVDANVWEPGVYGWTEQS